MFFPPSCCCNTPYIWLQIPECSKKTAGRLECETCDNFFSNTLCRNKGTDYICRKNANNGMSKNTAIGCNLSMKSVLSNVKYRSLKSV